MSRFIIFNRKKPKELRPVRKKIPNLLDKVREHIIWLRDSGAEHYKKNGRYFGGVVTKENLARHFGVPEGEIQHCLHKLNLEGFVSQAVKVNQFMHHDGEWVPDRYYIRNWIPVKEKKQDGVELVFNFKDCPICEEQLIESIRSCGFYSTHCENKCFKYVKSNGDSVVKIFE